MEPDIRGHICKCVRGCETLREKERGEGGRKGERDSNEASGNLQSIDTAHLETLQRKQGGLDILLIVTTTIIIIISGLSVVNDQT